MNKERTFTEILRDIVKTILEILKPADVQYTLDRYLEMLNPVVDDTIREGKLEGLIYKGGICRLAYDSNDKNTPIQIEIEMMFKKDESDKWVRKSISRRLEEKLFTEEAITALKENDAMEFDIKGPEENDNL